MAVGALTYAARHSLPEATLASLTATAAAVFGFDRLIDAAPPAELPGSTDGQAQQLCTT